MLNDAFVPASEAHLRRMNRVLDHIDAHLAEDLRLEALAEVASFSPFHFHRVFRAWTGETLLDFVRRRRLEAAGGRLRHSPRERVHQIALGAGFNSAEAFARAFKLHFGVTPTQWRRGTHAAGELPSPEASVQLPWPVQVRLWPECEVMYWRVRGLYSTVIPEAWDRFIPWITSLGLSGQPVLGMGLDDPLIAPPSRCRFDACVVLPPDFRPHGRLYASRKRVAGGWYACLAYEGPAETAGNGWQHLLTKWLPSSGFTVADGPFFESYPQGHKLPALAPLVRDLCMPVMR